MSDEFIKKLLLSNQSNVYSLIATTYYNKILELKPSLFKIFLTDQLQIPLDVLNIHSLKSAFRREKNKVATQHLTKKSLDKTSILEAEKQESGNYKFSNPDTDFKPSNHGIKVF